MDLYKEILVEVLKEQKVEVFFPSLTVTAETVVSTVCYRALEKIKEVIRDESLSDKECFDKIEEIICVLEKIGSNAGFRHDF